MRSVAERYAVAVVAFMAAAVWLGVSVFRGLECLFVFVAAAQALRLYERRRDSDRRSRSRQVPARAPGTASRQRTTARPASPRLYDDERATPDRPVASSSGW